MFKLMTAATALVVAALLSAVPAYAQMQQREPKPQPTPATAPMEINRWTITPFLAAGLGGDLDNSALSVGGALGYNITERVSVEGAVTYMNPEQGQLLQFETTVLTFDANVLYHFAEETWLPYLTIGLGAIYANADLEGIQLPGIVDESETSLALNLGGGVKRALSERILFRGDLRYYNGGDLTPDFWRLSAGLTFALDW